MKIDQDVFYVLCVFASIGSIVTAMMVIEIALLLCKRAAEK